MKIAIYFTVSAICLWPLGASANWQYTKWGMTTAQVQKASKNAAVPTTGESAGGETVKLTAPYSSGPFNFTASFWFDQSDHLTMVDLNLSEGNPNELIGSLRNKYGEPANHMPGIMTAYMWKTASDKISFINVGSKTSVSYSPRVTAKEKGL
jgi:hypothetical protein